MTDLLPVAKALTTHTDKEISALALWAVSKLEPNGEAVVAVLTHDEDGDPKLVCPVCDNDVFGYLEGCQDYRTPGGQRRHADGGTVIVKWAIDGTGESGDSNPGLFCDSYRGGGCGRPIELPDGWTIEFD